MLVLSLAVTSALIELVFFMSTQDLRQQLDKLLTKKITTPGPTCWNMSDPEGALMSAIADLITTEDQDYTVRGQNMGGSVGKHPHP